MRTNLENLVGQYDSFVEIPSHNIAIWRISGDVIVAGEE